MQACKANGIPLSDDLNTDSGSIGAAKVRMSLKLRKTPSQNSTFDFDLSRPKVTCIDQNGRCVTTESAYLTLEVLERPNLTIATYAHVTKILFEGPDEEPKQTVGVEFARSGQREGGKRWKVEVGRKSSYRIFFSPF